MAPVVHPGRLLKREMATRKLSANRLSLDIGVPSGRVTDILNGRRAITADTAVRLGLYFGNSAQFWLDLQSQYDIGVVERAEGCRTRQARQAGRCGIREPADAIVQRIVSRGRTKEPKAAAADEVRTGAGDGEGHRPLQGHAGVCEDPRGIVEAAMEE